MISDIELSNKSLLHILLFKGAVFERNWSRAIGNEGEKMFQLCWKTVSSWKTVLLALKKLKT